MMSGNKQQKPQPYSGVRVFSTLCGSMPDGCYYHYGDINMLMALASNNHPLIKRLVPRFSQQYESKLIVAAFLLADDYNSISSLEQAFEYIDSGENVCLVDY